MKNIILWGCGKYGQYIFDRLQSDIKGFHVVGVADSYNIQYNLEIERGEAAFAIEGLNKYVKKVYGYYDVKRMSDTGQIDGVIIAVMDRSQYRKIEETLYAMGIIVYDLKGLDRVSASEISVGSYRDEGSPFYVDILQNIWVEARPTLWGNFRFTYMITEEQKILWESDRLLAYTQFPWEDFPPSQDIKKIDLTIDKACSLLFLGTDRNYGHFIYACVSKIIQMEELGFDGKYLLYDSDFARKWIEIICKEWNISKERIIWVQNDLRGKVFLISQLHCIRNIADSSKQTAHMLLKLSNRLLSTEERLSPSSRPRLLYVKRSGTRKLLDCEGIIERYGFVTIEPEKLSIEDQIKEFNQADVVLAAHGAGVTNCLFMRPGSYLIQTFGAGFIDMFFVEMIKQKGIRFRMVVSQKDYQGYDFNDDYTIHPTLLDMTIKEVLDSLRQQGEG